MVVYFYLIGGVYGLGFIMNIGVLVKYDGMGYYVLVFDRLVVMYIYIENGLEFYIDSLLKGCELDFGDGL